MDRGHVVNWELQKTLWLRGLRSERLFNSSSASSSSAAPRNPKKRPPLGEAVAKGGGAVITLPLLCLASVSEAAREVAFDELGFENVALVPCAELAVASWCFENEKATNVPAAAAARAAIAVDVGFSATTACAVFDGRALLSTVRRVDLGGKALTNVMKDAVSFRAVDLRQESAVVEAMKNETCFVSLDLEGDLESAKKGLNALEWVLPDGTGEFGSRGRARPRLTREERKAAAKAAALEARAAALAAAEEKAAQKRPSSASKAAAPKEKETKTTKPKEETVVPLTLERFMVPEALFHPLDVGLPQGGIQEAVAACAAAAPARLRPLLLSNVLLFGGGAACPGIAERLERELRPLVPAEMEVAVRVVAGEESSSSKSGGENGGENGTKSKSDSNGPALAPWRGGSLLAGDSEWFESRAMTREQWEEARRKQRQEREQQQQQQQQQKFGRFGGGGGGARR